MTQINKPIKVLVIGDRATEDLLFRKDFSPLNHKLIKLKRFQLLGKSLDSLLGESFDVVILTLSFSSNEELDLVKEVKTVTKESPIIVLSNNRNPEIEVAISKEGIQDYLTIDNNFDSEEFACLLLNSIANAIGRNGFFSSTNQQPAFYPEVVGEQSSFVDDRDEKFRVVVNSTSVLIWMSDLNDRLTFVNRFWLEFIGKDSEAVLAENWLTNLHFKDRRVSQIVYQNAFNNRQYFDLECRLLNSQGEYRWFFITGVPRFEQANEFLGFVWSGVDISKQKQVETLLKRQARRNYILAKITRHIHKSFELATILQTTTEQVNYLLNVERIIISKIESVDNFKILSESTFPRDGDSCNLSPFLDLKLWQVDLNFDCLRAGEIIFLDRLKEDNRPEITARLTEQITRPEMITSHSASVSFSAVVVPIRVEQKLWGVICAEQCSEARQWTLEEISLLEQITTQLAIAIKQAELYQALENANRQLQQLTVIDSLTGIANRRRFDEYLGSEWNRLARENACLSLILCDVDHFKIYNDTYGHLAGDDCLQKIAQTIQKTVKRSADLVARYGGEEIAIILPNTSPSGAKALALDIRQNIQDLQIPHLNSTTNKYVTLSFGVAGCVPQSENFAQGLIVEADLNLYQAKETGRNRVVGA